MTEAEWQVVHHYQVERLRYAADHWVAILTGMAAFAAFTTMVVYFFTWRQAKKAPKVLIPVFIGADGKEVHPPTLKSKATLILPGDPRVKGLKMEDIIGQDAAKEDILEVIDFIKNRAKYERMEARLPKGMFVSARTEPARP